jgi:hypothetical protein
MYAFYALLIKKYVVRKYCSLKGLKSVSSLVLRHISFFLEWYMRRVQVHQPHGVEMLDVVKKN